MTICSESGRGEDKMIPGREPIIVGVCRPNVSEIIGSRIRILVRVVSSGGVIKGRQPPLTCW